jgi:high-affinity iron transporter
MLLNSVILVLQETLEVALSVSVLLAISHQQANRATWLLFGIVGGVFLSFLYAGQMAEISEWFDYVGQEIVNTVLQVSTTLLIVICTWALFRGRRINAGDGSSQENRFATLFIYCAASAVALTITKEGSEILLYLSGFLQQEEYFQTVMAGSSIGFCIGLSIGILLFYGLLNLPGKWKLGAPVTLLALFAGNMLSQAAQQLTQADWISSARTFWDTSDFLSENSIIGQLLYALVGYEATPSAAQLIAYTVGVILVLAFAASGEHSSRNDSGATL